MVENEGIHCLDFQVMKWPWPSNMLGLLQSRSHSSFSPVLGGLSFGWALHPSIIFNNMAYVLNATILLILICESSLTSQHYSTCTDQFNCRISLKIFWWDINHCFLSPTLSCGFAWLTTHDDMFGLIESPSVSKANHSDVAQLDDSQLLSDNHGKNCFTGDCLNHRLNKRSRPIN